MNEKPTYHSGLTTGRALIQMAAGSYLVILLVIPLAVILQDGLREGLGELWRQVNLPAARAALWLTLWTAGIMTIINTSMGLLTAYVLVRRTFPGKDLLNALIDLPLAIPTLVTGVMLVVLYGPQAALGAWMKDALDFKVIFAPPGIILALLFITFPFCVRTVQPVLAALETTQEDAAATLGASPWKIFWRVVMPPLVMPVLSGALLSYARAIGEFGAIVIVAGNIPLVSQTAAVYVLGEVESENRLGASAVSLVMAALAYGLVLLVDWMRTRAERIGR